MTLVQYNFLMEKTQLVRGMSGSRIFSLGSPERRCSCKSTRFINPEFPPLVVQQFTIMILLRRRM